MVRLTLNRVCIQKNKKETECRFVPHSLNKKQHWALKARWKIAWEEEVAWTVYQNRKKLGKLPYGLAKIHIRYYSIHLMDQDNLWGSVKPIVDGLKKAGVVIDDSPKYLDLTVAQHKVNYISGQKVEIVIF